MKFCVWTLPIIALFATSLLAQQSKKPLVHPLFTDHMVLQRDAEVPVWGWAKPGEQIAVSFAGQSATATANEDGKWKATLGPFAASPTGRTLKVAGNARVEVSDVLVGDVWICSGQSNMEWSVAASDDSQTEIAAADYPQIRLFTVGRRVSVTPQEMVDSEWEVCSKHTIARFSAVGYFFGRALQRDLDVPIGLIHTSWGGTVAEAWTSAEALQSMPDFEPQVRQFETATHEIASGKFSLAEHVSAWWSNGDEGTAGGWSAADFDHSNWKQMDLPVNWEQANAGLDMFDGIVWFRREFELPADWNNKDLQLQLGPIDDADTTYVNGHQVGSVNGWSIARKYHVPAKHLKPGRNVIAIRVYDGSGGGGIYGTDHTMQVIQANDKSKSIPLDGAWKYQATAHKRDLPAFPQSITENPNTTTVLYNGMLAPLKPFGIKGAIWYQGESNADRAMQYRRLLPAMIQDWRKQFGQGDFPFLIVQLANFMQPQSKPVESGWAELREAQALTAKNDPNTGLAVITDIGEADDIHPRNKQDVGERLALQALEIAYGKAGVVSSGPTVGGMNIVGDTVEIEFNNTGEGLMVPGGGALQGFAVAEKEGEFVWAEATMEGDKVVLWNEGLAEPIRVRYNWANNPLGNLFNKAGLPAAPFRTDVPRTISPQPLSKSALPPAKPESVGMSAEKLAELTPTLQKFVDDKQVAGAIAIVARRGKIVYFDAVGARDVKHKRPMEKNSILRFYSMTKAVTSVSIMMLVEEGKLQLDDPVEKYIPELANLQVVVNDKDDNPALETPTRKMTVRDLLRHTSGLTYGFFGETSVDKKYRAAGVMSDKADLQAFAEKLGTMPLLYQPGVRFNYSVSTDVLGHLVEKLSGMTLDQFFAKRVFEPLGMKDTAFEVASDKAERFATNYGASPLGLAVIDDAAKSKYLKKPTFFSGGGGLVSTASDYIQFCQMLLNKGELGGKRLLTAETVELMTRNHLSKSAYPINLNGPRAGVGFGLGFSVVVEQTDYTGAARLGEYGWGGAASTHYWISPADEIAVVVLSQLMPFTFQLEDAVKPIVYDAIKQ